MKQKIKESLKNLLIAVLLCALLLLSVAALPTRSIRATPWLSRLLQPVAPLLGLPRAEVAYVKTAESALNAAQPIAISVHSTGGRSTAMWDFAKLDSRLDALGKLMGSAFSQAENFSEATMEQVQDALMGNSIYFRYAAPLPAELIGSWLGAAPQAELPAFHTCILAQESSTLYLYLVGERIITAQTHLPADELLNAASPYQPDGSRFAFETEYPLAPLSLLADDSPRVPVTAAEELTAARYSDAIATELGFNPYGETRYADESGAVHYSETNCTLVVEPDADVVLYAAGSDRYAAGSGELQSLAEAARSMMERVFRAIPGDGRLYLSGVEQKAAQTVFLFDYVVNGIPLVLPQHGAQVTFEGTSISDMRVHLYAFSDTGKSQCPLPVPQAVTLIEEGQPLELAYYLNQNRTLTAAWRQ